MGRCCKTAVNLTVVATLLGSAAAAQDLEPIYAIRGARIYTLAGPPIENGTVLIRDGKIAAVGARVSLPREAQVIDATGLEVYPGLMDPISRLGLVEIRAVPATVDTNEVGAYNPQLLAATAVHPASEHILVARANGITHAVSTPRARGFGGIQGAVIPGQASLIHLAGWTIEDMLIRPSVGMLLRWPSITSRSRQRPFTEVKKKYEEKVGKLEDWIEAAKHYAQAVEKGSAANFEHDLKLEALTPVVRGRLPLIVMANDARDIRNSVDFAEKHKMKMILAGGAEAWKVKDLLKKKNISVILHRTQALPRAEDEPYDKPFTNAGELHSAGIKIAFATFSSSVSRTLPYQAANAVPYGLPWEEALKGHHPLPRTDLRRGRSAGND